MQNTNAVDFKIEGTFPDWLIDVLKHLFGSVCVENENSNKDEFVDVNSLDWFNDVRSKMTPAENLKLLRNNFGITQTKLAEKVGIKKQQISAMENGKVAIGRKMAHKLAEALGTSYKNLFW